MASKLTTLSAQDMIKAMIAGERNPQALAGLARGRMKARHGDLAGALDGMSGDHHGELAQMLPGQVAFPGERISALTARIEQAVTAIPAAWGVDADGATGPDAGTGPDAAALPAVQRLAEVPGIGEDLAERLDLCPGLPAGSLPAAAQAARSRANSLRAAQQVRARDLDVEKGCRRADRDR